MSLTPEIVKSMEPYPLIYKMTWCWEFLVAQADNRPAEVAARDATLAARIATYGFDLDPATAKKLDTEQWILAGVGRVWEVYLGQAYNQAVANGDPLVSHELTDHRSSIIRQSLARWSKVKQRQGGSCEDCLKDQIRGAFYRAQMKFCTTCGDEPKAHTSSGVCLADDCDCKEYQPPTIRLDPEGVLAFNKTTRGHALAWWTHLAFEEE